MRGSYLGAAMSVALAVAAFSVAHAAGPKDPPLNESARHVRDLREAVLSPDASKVAAVVTASTAEGGQNHIWLLGTDGKSSRQLTFSSADTEPGERSPAWSNDGAVLYFTAKRGKASRLHRLPLAGGEAQSLVIARPATGAVQSGWALDAGEAVEASIQGYEVSPNDRWIALIAEDGEAAARTAQVKKDDGVEVGKDDEKKSRLYLVEAATGKAREIALPDNARSARWNAASDELIVVTAPPEEDLGPAARVWRVRAADGSSAQLKTLPNTTTNPQWASGGLVYLAQCGEDAPPGCADLYSYDFKSGASKNLTLGLKGSIVENMVVEEGGKAVITPVQVGFHQRLARIALADGALTWLDFPVPVVGGAAANRRQTGWVFLAGGPLQPKAVYFTPKLDAAPLKLAGPAMVPPDWPATPSQLVTWTNGKLTLKGMLYMPKLAAGAKAPLVVHIHGGPSGLFQDVNYNIVNLLTAQGWAVFQPNPRGSLGYGAAFLAAVKNDLGGGDYTDIMTGVDAVIARYPVDPAKMALIGYSYGGEMAGFVEGRTDRFKALVSGAPVIDQFSEYGTEDSSFYDRWYFGKPWEHFAEAWRQSPLARVGEARTPLLLLQGEDDPSDPLGQSQEMRRAMKQVGAPVTLITYPRETHASLHRNFYAETNREPWHGVDLRRRMIQFIADAFSGKAPAVAP